MVQQYFPPGGLPKTLLKPQPPHTQPEDAAHYAAWYDYWFAAIDESEAAEFDDVSVRTMQAWRARGGGPKYIRYSSRCLRYTRAQLKKHQDQHLAKSTSDPVEAADALAT